MKEGKTGNQSMTETPQSPGKAFALNGNKREQEKLEKNVKMQMKKVKKIVLL